MIAGTLRATVPEHGRPPRGRLLELDLDAARRQ
jgi:hypothetical protein